MKGRIYTAGHTHPVALAVTVIAAGTIALAGSLNMRAQAVPGESAERAVMSEATAVYFPAQYVNQGRDFDPETPTF